MLKECPFCGGKALYTPYSEDVECINLKMPKVECIACGASVTMLWDEYDVLRLKNDNLGGYVSQETMKDFEQLVTAKWNKRYGK